ncbi:MAG: cell division protein ZapE [Gammaproteobacteria bacterium]|nr:cell division protein ZapE [Gammaproteobacteria bacterium]MDH4253004.1 cell division protein ZapE [Gammaproteobacteria bacterium]MDH5308574.1 cell division protein ZapE [Gammaproteobacteria bacterium]
MDIRSAYTADAKLVADPAQQRVVGALYDLQSRLLQTEPRRGLGRLLPRPRQAPTTPGIYLCGGVGRGKTMLMDLFFETLAIRSKRRSHFHRMMNEVHARLKAQGDVQRPLDRVAADLASETRVLCFDEFFVSDIGDAMILGGLLDGLFRRGVTLVATSNSRPEELYANGLQRERFLPAIRLLREHTTVVELDDGTDYRLRLMKTAGTWFDSREPGTEARIREYFDRMAPGRSEGGRRLDILGRELTTIREAKGVVWFDFAEICGGPRSPTDYIEIARWYQAVIVSNVPVLTRETEDAARRFIALVDEFYDRRVKLILAAGAGVDSLYRGSRLTLEFERTRSRLVEMQSQDYLHSPHRA